MQTKKGAKEGGDRDEEHTVLESRTSKRTYYPILSGEQDDFRHYLRLGRKHDE
jgi:hypothetical protein